MNVKWTLKNDGMNSPENSRDYENRNVKNLNIDIKAEKQGRWNVNLTGKSHSRVTATKDHISDIEDELHKNSPRKWKDDNRILVKAQYKQPKNDWGPRDPERIILWRINSQVHHSWIIPRNKECMQPYSKCMKNDQLKDIQRKAPQCT